MPVTNAGGSSWRVLSAARRLSTSMRSAGSLPQADRKAVRSEGGSAAASWNNSSIRGQFLDMESSIWYEHSLPYAICLRKTPHRATLISVNVESGGGDTDTLLDSVYDELRRL